ncbi:MAG TPA: hypothetical protein VF941_05305, partial [Clostridia bacterium]
MRCIRKCFSILLILLLVISVMPSTLFADNTTTANNLITNPKMNTDSNKDNVCDGFTKSFKDVVAAYSIENNSQKIEITGESTTPGWAAISSNSVSVVPGDIISFGGYAKKQGDVDVTIGVNFSSNGKYVSSLHASLEDLSDTFINKENVVIPSGVDSVCLVC